MRVYPLNDFRPTPIVLITLILSGLQFGDANNLNGMPIAKVRALVADLDKAKTMAKAGNLEFLVGQSAADGKGLLTVHGELTDAECYVARGVHADDHAFCATACVVGKSPIVFLADSGKVYLVLNSQLGIPLPDKILDQIGVPGIEIKARIVETGKMEALAIDSLQ